MWDCFPKVEILKTEKAARKTRLISGAPAGLFFLGAELYETTNSAFCRSTIVSKSAVGLNLSGGGMEDLYRWLPDYVDVNDATGYDQSLSPCLLYWVYRVREDMMKLNDNTRALHWAYFRQICRRFCFTSNGNVWYVNGGNGSGQYNTSIDNTIAHMIIIAYAMVQCGYTYGDFVRFRSVLYGDDYIAPVMPKLFWYHYQMMGIRVKFRSPCHKDDSEFLSHKFVKTGYGIVGKLKHNKSLYSCYTSEKKNWREFRREKLYSLWLLHFFHEDREVYEELLKLFSIPYSIMDAIRHWTYRMAGGFKVSSHDEF